VKGAIGAVGQQIADLKARAVIDLDPHLIRAGGMADRLEDDDTEDARLRDSIAAHGQQVPVLVRPHPEEEDRYQIVYGRRRVLAAQDLGISVKAMVRDLDDRALILAQGQENTARRDLSFIEKAHFARQLRDAGYDRRVIADALNIDKTGISRMLAVADRIPESMLHAIGSAPGIGRARWLKLADMIEADGTTISETTALAYGDTSDARFEAMVHALSLPARRARAAEAAAKKADRRVAEPVHGADGRVLGKVRRAGTRTVISLDGDDGFARWLAGNLGELHRRWQQGS